MSDATNFEDFLDEAIDSGSIIIGTPETLIEKIRQLAKQTGGFGAFVMTLADFADHDAKKKSIELFANRVVPEFRGYLPSLRKLAGVGARPARRRRRRGHDLEDPDARRDRQGDRAVRRRARRDARRRLSLSMEAEAGPPMTGSPFASNESFVVSSHGGDSSRSATRSFWWLPLHGAEDVGPRPRARPRDHRAPVVADDDRLLLAERLDDADAVVDELARSL